MIREGIIKSSGINTTEQSGYLELYPAAVKAIEATREQTLPVFAEATEAELRATCAPDCELAVTSETEHKIRVACKICRLRCFSQNLNAIEDTVVDSVVCKQLRDGVVGNEPVTLPPASPTAFVNGGRTYLSAAARYLLLDGRHSTNPVFRHRKGRRVVTVRPNNDYL